jgi:uncharacterized protein (DUF427 family)
MENPQNNSLKESVWDYPRPPRVESAAHRVRVIFNGEVVADSRRAMRVLETSHPPVYYIPPEDVKTAYLHPSPRRTICEFKGAAHYWTLRVGGREARDAVWSYPRPSPGYEAIAHYYAFYPGRMDACYVGEERVKRQPGDFYGGWVTINITGPFKGGAGTEGW